MRYNITYKRAILRLRLVTTAQMDFLTSLDSMDVIKSRPTVANSAGIRPDVATIKAIGDAHIEAMRKHWQEIYDSMSPPAVS